jgi:phosphoglycolate phosphatase-like HAD superfamily hydrolase
VGNSGRDREKWLRYANYVAVAVGEVFTELAPERRPLPGAVELLRFLKENGATYGIATSGRRPEIDKSLKASASARMSWSSIAASSSELPQAFFTGSSLRSTNGIMLLFEIVEVLARKS